MPVASTTSVNGVVTVNVPFAFSVQSEQFSAGEYSMSLVNERTVAIRDTAGKKAIVAITNTVTKGSEVLPPQLVFHRYGTQYFLTQAWLRQSDTGREFLVTPDEIRMAREYPQQQVTLVAKK